MTNIEGENNTPNESAVPGAAEGETKETFVEKVEEKVKEVIEDVKEGVEKIEEKVEEAFEKVKEEFTGTKTTDEAEATKSVATDQTNLEDSPANITDLKQDDNAEHDSVTANGGQITNLADSGDPLKEVPGESLDEVNKGVEDENQEEDLNVAPKAEDAEESKPVEDLTSNVANTAEDAKPGVDDRPRGGYPGELASNEPAATK